MSPHHASLPSADPASDVLVPASLNGIGIRALEPTELFKVEVPDRA